MPFLPLVDVFGDEHTNELFSEAALAESWLEVERALASAQAELGLIPAEVAQAIVVAASVERIDLGLLRRRARIVGYPILPLLDQVKAGAAPEVAAYLHWGATTQDIMDTGLALVLKRVLERVETLAIALGDAIAALAEEHRATMMPGRTHGRPAVPITFGGKLAVWLAELVRHLERVRTARERVAVVQLFGAAGTAAALGQASRELRHRVADRLSLGHADVPWHTARDSLAELAFALASVAATCGKLAREVIDLSRPEIGEVGEASGEHRGASSTMPQKANPIESEVVVGFSILAAGQVSALLAAMQAGHERATGEWQAEWDAVPFVAAASAGALAAATRLVEGLQVFPDRMRTNLGVEDGLIMAEAVMMSAASVIGRGPAHDAVYRACTAVRAERLAFPEALRRELGEEVLASLPPLETLLEPAHYLGETDAIVDSALKAWQEAGTARR
jgi:3-carboxy-cis,cis-muconate cycloisomerase